VVRVWAAVANPLEDHTISLPTRRGVLPVLARSVTQRRS
jgi:hypothetical protein